MNIISLKDYIKLCFYKWKHNDCA